MQPVQISDNIYWVGGVDWDLRDFHGYVTRRGSSYNAYLIVDEKITLVDTVKHYLFDEMMARISRIVDPSKIDYVISNHVEMDHSGGLPELMKAAPNAVVVTSPNGEKGLRAHYKKDWNFRIVKSGDVLNIGRRNINFVLTPMIHWPDNMVSYVPEDRLLFSNDAFGQHIASSERLDHELPYDMVKEEAARYYANIVLPYSIQVQKALETVGGLDRGIIAPSHGVVWKSHIKDILEEYGKWSANQTENKAVIVYDSMWESTGKIAYAVQSAFEDKGVTTRMFNLKANHNSDIMTEVLNARYICVGSSTLNNNMLPTVASFLTYMKGLAPKNRVGLAFGSYGWGGQSIAQVEEVLKGCGFEMLESIKYQYIPEEGWLGETAGKLKEQIV